MDDPLFLSETAGPLGDVHAYAQHIKSEVTAALTSSEAVRVVQAATLSAERDLLTILNALSADSADRYPAALSAWCNGKGKRFVRGVIAKHDGAHDQIDRVLAEAKQDR
jgi:hypothetical protein